MVMHVTLLCEDLVSFVTNTYVVILMIYAYLSTWLNEDAFLDTRMIDMLISKQFPRILVNDKPSHY